MSQYIIEHDLLQQVVNILTANPSPAVPVGQVVNVLAALQQLPPMERPAPDGDGEPVSTGKRPMEAVIKDAVEKRNTEAGAA